MCFCHSTISLCEERAKLVFIVKNISQIDYFSNFIAQLIQLLAPPA